MTDRRLVGAAIVALVAAVGLMVPFEGTLTRVLGVIAILAFIAVGTFAIATPEYLAVDEGDELDE